MYGQNLIFTDQLVFMSSQLCLKCLMLFYLSTPYVSFLYFVTHHGKGFPYHFYLRWLCDLPTFPQMPFQFSLHH